MKRTKITLLFIVIWALTSLAQQQDTERFAKVINRLVEAMNKHDYTGIVREYDAGMTTAFPLTNTTVLFKNYETQYGRVVRTDQPQIRSVDQAVCVIYFERGVQDLTLYLNDQDKIKGFIFTTHIASETKPAQQAQPAPTTTQTSPAPSVSAPVTVTPPATVQTAPAVSTASASTATTAQPAAPVIADKQQTELSIPFKNTWTVITGGKPREGSAKSNLLQQQFAYEFSAVDSDGSRYRTDGKANEDYYSYGKDVLATADGTVIEVIDGIQENSPGSRNPYAPIGNAVTIQHSTREYSVLSYLKPGSIRVKPGDRVTRGQVIAQCGNSGGATEPSIHYHLQDSPYLQTAKGLKFYFERAMVTKEGKKELKLNYLPEAGESASPE